MKTCVFIFLLIIFFSRTKGQALEKDGNITLEGVKLDPIDRLSAIYLQRIIGIAANMANVDSNVKNILSRAYVWDTMQHHVSAWNDQLKSLDRKVDIISSGQEKLIALDAKLSSFVNLEYKVERVLAKLDSVQSRLDSEVRGEGTSTPNPLYREFTTRGVLSTLKILEHKVDRLQTIVERQDLVRSIPNKSRNSSTESNILEMARGRFIIKCTTPPIVEELVKDMASKVDLIYDKIAAEPESDDNDDVTDGVITMETFAVDLETPDKLTSRGSPRTNVYSRNFQVVQTGIDQILTILKAGNKTGDRDSHSEDVEALLLNSTNKITNQIDDSKELINKRLDVILNATERVVYLMNAVDKCDKNSDISNEIGKINNTEQETVKFQEEPTTSIAGFDDDVNNPTECEYGFKTTVPELSCSIVRNNKRYIEKICQSPEYFDNRICTEHGGVIIQQRSSLTVGFNQTWSQYKLGFGDFQSRDFWLGNEAIQSLTSHGWNVLKIIFTDFGRETAWAEYSFFKVYPESTGYELNVSGYSGNATDSFSNHSGMKFSTYDVKNDLVTGCCPCALSYGSGWWFHSCFESNLNGQYYDSQQEEYYKGITWEGWKGGINLASTTMILHRSDYARVEDVPEDP